MGWQDDFKLRGDLVQEDMYPFEETLRELGGTKNGLTANSAHLLKSAIAAGWVESPACEVLTDGEGEKRYMLEEKNVDQHKPGEVLWYGSRVGEHYAKAIEIPKN